MLTREQILQADDVVKELVPVPEWNGDVYVRVMSGSARDAFQLSLIERVGDEVRSKPDDYTAKLLCRCICDESGKLLFSLSDVATLGKRNSLVLERIHTVACRLNKVGRYEIESAAKNSVNAQSADSGSGSLGISDAASEKLSSELTQPNSASGLPTGV